MDDLDGIERTLEVVSRKAPPDGLKQKVLSAAHQKKKQTLTLNPVFRTAAGLSFLLIALVLFADQWISRAETRNLAALLEYRSSVDSIHESGVRELIAELGTEDLGRSLSEWMLRRYRIQERTARTEYISRILSHVWEEINEDQD